MLNTTVFCFLASYIVALVLELSRLLGRSKLSRAVMVGFGLAGFVAHTFYLINRGQQMHLPPLLASTHDWMLVLAWVIVLFYLFLTLMQRELAIGVFALPVVISLVVSTYFMNQEANTLLNIERARRGWGILHASLLVFGMAGVFIGFVSGMMYLAQHRRLKTGHRQTEGLKMPSLETLAQSNRWSVMIAFLLLSLGFGTGIYIGVSKIADAASRWYADPAIILSGVFWVLLAAMFGWLVRHKRPAGKQVAWLTIYACGTLLLTIVGLLIVTGSFHTNPTQPRTAPENRHDKL